MESAHQCWEGLPEKKKVPWAVAEKPPDIDGRTPLNDLCCVCGGRRPSLPAATHKVNAIHRQVSEPAGEEAHAARRPAAVVPIGRRYSAPPMVFSVNENDSEDTTRLQPVLESPRRENTIS